MPLSTRAKRTLQSNTATTETKAKKRSANSKPKAPKKKANVQKLTEQTDREQKANEDKDESSDADSCANFQEDVEITKETSNLDMEKLIAEARASTWHSGQSVRL